ncbi:MAG: hypothetical protein ACRDO1_03465 [Nocardioidaceae bacterium]
MSFARKIAASAALATVATLALGVPSASAASTNMWWDGDDDGSLVNVSENNVGPFQACNNNVPVNVLGIQGAVSDLAGVVGFGNDGNSNSTVKNCDQDSYQDN